MALSRLEPMGTKRSTDLVLLEMIRARLCNLHTAEAEHWDGQAQRFRAGEHFEAAAEASNNFKDGIRLLHRAARAYARAEPARHTDFARVMQKINDWMAVHPEQR